ncbi:hypothetical protein TNCV_3879471 [Trichonephila clavipes]|nr:hypothetical protein TNCV_3879471 [Trichonephila clavipes]
MLTPLTPEAPRLTLINITFCGIKGSVCADTGSSHAIVGKKDVPRYLRIRNPFPGNHISKMSLADCQQTTGEAPTTQVMVKQREISL